MTPTWKVTGQVVWAHAVLLLVAELLVVVLAILFMWRPAFLTREIYKLTFLVGVVVFISTISTMFLNGSSVFTRYSGSVSWGTFLITFAAVTPYLLLIEIGISGHRGFSSWIRYASLWISVVGGLSLIATILVPRFLRR